MMIVAMILPIVVTLAGIVTDVKAELKKAEPPNNKIIMVVGVG